MNYHSKHSIKFTRKIFEVALDLLIILIFFKKKKALNIANIVMTFLTQICRHILVDISILLSTSGMMLISINLEHRLKPDQYTLQKKSIKNLKFLPKSKLYVKP